MIWLVAEISGVLTQLGVAEVADTVWGVPGAGAEPAWVWSEKLAAGTHKGLAWVADDQARIGSVSGTHADVAPHLVSDLPVVDCLAQDHDTDGHVINFTLVDSTHTLALQSENGDTSYVESGTTGDDEFMKAVTLGLAGSVPT